MIALRRFLSAAPLETDEPPPPNSGHCRLRATIFCRNEGGRASATPRVLYREEHVNVCTLVAQRSERCSMP